MKFKVDLPTPADDYGVDLDIPLTQVGAKLTADRLEIERLNERINEIAGTLAYWQSAFGAPNCRKCRGYVPLPGDISKCEACFGTSFNPDWRKSKAARTEAAFDNFALLVERRLRRDGIGWVPPHFEEFECVVDDCEGYANAYSPGGFCEGHEPILGDEE